MNQKQYNQIVDIQAAKLVGYTENVLGFSHYGYQRYELGKIFRNMLLGTAEELTELWARQTGKTTMGMSAIFGGMVFFPMWARDKTILTWFPQLRHYLHGFEAGLVGPKQELAGIPFNRIRKLLKRRGVEENLWQLGIEVLLSNSETLELSNGSRAKAMSGAETSFNEGESFHYLHFEECQRLSQFKIYKTFHPMLASTGGMTLKVGTPDYHRGAFYNMIQRNKLHFSQNHGEYPWHYGANANEDYKRFVLKEMDRLGADSDAFRMSYLLEWILATGMLFPIELWREMAGDGLEGRPKFCQGEWGDGVRKVYGLDVARQVDSTVLTMGEDHRDHRRIVDWVLIPPGTPYEDQYEIIVSTIKSVGDGPLVVDATGMGDPVFERLEKELGAQWVHGVTYSSHEKDRLYKLLTTESKAGRVYYPSEVRDKRLFQRFEQECLDCETEVRGNLMTFAAPEDSEDGEEIHDDFPCSLANMVDAAVGTGSESYGAYGGCQF